MSMNIQSGDENEVMVDINTTPLIDVMLVLLIMLIITIPIQTHAIKLDMPRPNATARNEPPQIIEIRIDFDGALEWNGEMLNGISQLETFLTQAAGEDPQPELHIRPNKLAKYQYVATVMAAAQRIGVTRIGIVGNEHLND